MRGEVGRKCASAGAAIYISTRDTNYLPAMLFEPGAGYQSSWDHEPQGPPCLNCNSCDCACDEDYEPITMSREQADALIEELKRSLNEDLAFRSAA